MIAFLFYVTLRVFPSSIYRIQAIHINENLPVFTCLLKAIILKSALL